jgi:hypothetical protein
MMMFALGVLGFAATTVKLSITKKRKY